MEEEEEPVIEEPEHPQQEQVHSLLFNRDLGWQELIYDLINTEQLDPWNINISILTEKYLAKIHELEGNDFFVSSKVLLAAALLLRIKSEILLNTYIKSIDDILFGKKEEPPRYEMERIDLEEDIPELIPRSPLPRFKKVTLQELLESLNKAIVTENRRIKKEVMHRNALRETSFSLPKRKYTLVNKIKEIHGSLLELFKKSKRGSVSFAELSPKEKEEKIIHFSSLLHLENQKKIWLDQKEHFGDINIWQADEYLKNNDPFSDLRTEENL